MSIEVYLAFALATFVIIIIPGPTVTVILANSFAHGTRAGLLNVVGTQIGLAFMFGVFVLGFASIIEFMGHWFEWLRLAGAAYLIWLGFKMIRANGSMEGNAPRPAPRGGFVLQGLLVVLSNPKVLLFFGAFIPQFINPAGDYWMQLALTGATFMTIAALSDGAYALAAGRAGKFLSRQRMRLVSRLSGLMLIGGGVWIALTRRA